MDEQDVLRCPRCGGEDCQLEFQATVAVRWTPTLLRVTTSDWAAQEPVLYCWTCLDFGPFRAAQHQEAWDAAAAACDQRAGGLILYERGVGK